MDGKLNLTEKDKEELIKFLNLVAANAEFKFKTKELIDYFKSLSYIQQTLLPKIESNILEVKRIVEAKKED